MKKLFTILCLLFVTAYAHAYDHILMILKNTDGSNIVYVLDDSDFGKFNENTHFYDAKDNKHGNQSKSTPYKTTDGYYAFQYSIEKWAPTEWEKARKEQMHKDADEDYKAIQKKLEKFFPGIQAILVLENYDKYWYCRLDFQKNVTFTHPDWTGGQPISCEIETLYVSN